MNLIILTEKDYLDKDRYQLYDHRAEHIITILKLKKGDKVEVGILNGPTGMARIDSIEDGLIELTCEKLETPAVIVPDVTLICALPRPQTLKKVLIISAMMGVRDIHLIRANRVEKSYFQSPLVEKENFTPYLIEGLSQGKLTALPKVTIHRRFKPFFEDAFADMDKDDTPKLLPDPESVASLDRVYDSAADKLILAVGPEGGWVPFEIEMMEKRGFKRFKLSRSILRVENALTVALAQIELIKMRQEK